MINPKFLKGRLSDVTLYSSTISVPYIYYKAEKIYGTKLKKRDEGIKGGTVKVEGGEGDIKQIPLTSSDFTQFFKMKGTDCQSVFHP